MVTLQWLASAKVCGRDTDLTNACGQSRKTSRKNKLATALPWFPKRCRFGASPSVVTKFSTHDRPPTKSVTIRLFMCACMFVTSVCAYLRVGGEQLCTIDFDVCTEREWVFCNVGDDGVSVWFQLSTKWCGHDKMRHFLREKTGSP